MSFCSEVTINGSIIMYYFRIDSWYTSKGILIIGLALFPIIALWLNTESLLLLVQQTPCVARLVLIVQINYMIDAWTLTFIIFCRFSAFLVQVFAISLPV